MSRKVAKEGDGERRLRADAARNRMRVLAAAREVFGELGPDARMEEVARRAGVGVGTLYRRFPTKEALLDALISERVDGIREAAEAALREPDSWAALRGMIWHLVEVAAEDRALLPGIASSTHLPPTTPSMEFTETQEERGGPPRMLGLEEPIGKLLRRAQEEGEARADLVAADLPLMFSGVMMMALDAPRVQEAEETWRRHVAVVLDGLRESSRGAAER